MTTERNIIIVGNPSTGKTNLMTKLTNNTFTDKLDPTIGVEFNKRLVNNTKLYIWTSNLHRCESLVKNYYRDANIILIVFDLTDRKSFDTLPNWIDEAKTYASRIPIILVGTKADLKIGITDKEIETLKFPYFKVSSKYSRGINLLLSQLTKQN